MLTTRRRWISVWVRDVWSRDCVIWRVQSQSLWGRLNWGLRDRCYSHRFKRQRSEELSSRCFWDRSGCLQQSSRGFDFDGGANWEILVGYIRLWIHQGIDSRNRIWWRISSSKIAISWDLRNGCLWIHKGAAIRSVWLHCREFWWAKLLDRRWRCGRALQGVQRLSSRRRPHELWRMLLYGKWSACL